MRKIIYFALLTVKQATREKAFRLGWFLLLLLSGFALFLGELAVGEKEVVLRNAQFSFIEFSGLLMILFGLHLDWLPISGIRSLNYEYLPPAEAFCFSSHPRLSR